MLSRERGIVDAAWRQAITRGGRSTIGAALLAIAGEVVP